METYKKTTTNLTADLNIIRIELKDNTLTSVEFSKLFKSKKLSYATFLASFLIKQGILSKQEDGKYGFTDINKPIHIKLIDSFIKESRKKQKEYNDKYYASEKTITITTSDGIKIAGTEHTNYRVVTISGQFVIIDENNNIIKVF